MFVTYFRCSINKKAEGRKEEQSWKGNRRSSYFICEKKKMLGQMIAPRERVPDSYRTFPPPHSQAFNYNYDKN